MDRYILVTVEGHLIYDNFSFLCTEGACSTGVDIIDRVQCATISEVMVMRMSLQQVFAVDRTDTGNFPKGQY